MTDAGTADTASAVGTADRPAYAGTELLAGVLVAALAGAGLAGAAYAGATALLVAVAVLQALLAPAWVLGTAMPGRRGGIALALLAAGGADVAVSMFPHGRLGALVAVLGLIVPAMFVHQLTRGAARVQIVSSLSAIALLLLAEAALPALIQLRHEFTTVHDAEHAGRVVAAAVAAIGGALVVGYLVDMVVSVPRFDPAVARGLPALLASTALGGALGYLILRSVPDFAAGRSIFVGAALGALSGLLSVAAAFVLHATAASTPVGRLLRPAVAALLPLFVLAPVAFLLCLAIRA